MCSSDLDRGTEVTLSLTDVTWSVTLPPCIDDLSVPPLEAVRAGFTATVPPESPSPGRVPTLARPPDGETPREGYCSCGSFLNV